MFNCFGAMEESKFESSLELEDSLDSNDSIETRKPSSVRLYVMIVACIQMVFFGLSLVAIAVFGLVLTLCHPTTSVRTITLLDHVHIWITSIFLSFAAGLQLWAAIQLLQSTEIETPAFGRLKFAQYWKEKTILFIVLDFFYCIAAVPIVLVWLPFTIIRIGFLYLVNNYREELKMELPPISNATRVIYTKV